MGIALMTGVESVESSSRQKATKNSIDKGVAGRSMLAENVQVGYEMRRARDGLSRLGVVLSDS
jgi:hypothetical protein